MKKEKLWFYVYSFITISVLIIIAFFVKIKIDTDPENMLSVNEKVRVFHNEKKRDFNLYDAIVVGIINKKHNNGVFNTKSLKNIYDLTNYAKTLNWQENGKSHGVIASEIIAPSTVDNIEQENLGNVKFEWLMQTVPVTDEESLAIANKAKKIPFLKNTLTSDDDKSIAIYIPLINKKDSYQVVNLLKQKIESLPKNNDEFYITGLPIAQDQFGVEMFKQMAISSPIAMLLIFLLMWIFFRQMQLIISPMLVAIISVILTMGLLIITGNTIHIMSSMIPIFIMPIAILDCVHILSDFFDKYPVIKDKKKTIKLVMHELFKPMLFTSITTCIGFLSLALTPIPPVRIFGIFIAIGVVIAWIVTITLIPAYIMLIPDNKLNHWQDNDSSNKLLNTIGKVTFKYNKIIILFSVLILAISYIGIQKIIINDNPVKWFKKNHEIRIADYKLNKEFAGTYMAFLNIESKKNNFLETENLEYIEKLQEYLIKNNKIVGKINSLPDIVKTVHRELFLGEQAQYKIPKTKAAVSQVLLTYQSSHRPQDLWHFVTPDYKQTNLWLQLRSGDNKDMQTVIADVNEFLKNNPSPFDIKADWFGLTYINVVWQEKMVQGMLDAFVGSFIIILIIMSILFRSIYWGILSMIPLSLTIFLIYSIIGFIGKDYDMPIAVLSSLSLGLAVDYSIHFLARSKEIYKKYNSWNKSISEIFKEPVIAIVRNVIIIGIGFMPLILSPLVPYKTVGIFISAILLFAGFATIFILPALICVFEKFLFKKEV